MTVSAHALEHQTIEDTPALDRRRARQLFPVVDAERFVGIADHHGFDPGAGSRQDADRIRQVVLALIVVRFDAVERRPQPSGVEAVHARVDLGGLLLVVGRVALFHDARHAAALAEHPAITVRIGGDRAQDRGRGARRAVVDDEPLERLAGEERHVAGNDEHGPAGGVGSRLPHGVARPEPLALFHDGHPRAGHRGDSVAVRADDEHETIRDHARGPQRVRDQRSTAERVKDLWLPRPHPLAFAGGQDDHGDVVRGGSAHISIIAGKARARP